MEASPRYTFTVFTPTHNRAHTLERVYKSLCYQTFRDFEWLVIDNESQDGTPQLIEQWRNEASFPIHYTYKHNEGYFVSRNLGIQKAQGAYWLELSSDDACSSHTLERFLFHWNSIPADQRSHFSTVTALSVDQYGRLHGQRFPKDVIDSNFTEMRYRYRVGGEKWGCQRIEIAREHPYITLPNGDLAIEAHVWRNLGEHYYTRYINEVLLTFWSHDEQLTKGDPADHSRRNTAWHQTVLNDDIRWFRWAPVEFLRSAVHYSRFSFHQKIGIAAQKRALHNPLAQALWLAGLPLGLASYQRDKRRTARVYKTQQAYG